MSLSSFRERAARRHARYERERRLRPRPWRVELHYKGGLDRHADRLLAFLAGRHSDDSGALLFGELGRDHGWLVATLDDAGTLAHRLALAGHFGALGHAFTVKVTGPWPP